MKAIRTSLAAALLLSPLAAFVATPAAADYAYRVAAPSIAIPAPVIEHFAVRPTGPVEPGRVIRFELHGTAGAHATLDIPGVARDLVMRETRQGVYEAGYVMRIGQQPQAFTRTVATLRNGPFAATAYARVEGRGWRDGDQAAPRISDLTPIEGSRVHERGRTEVSASFEDRRSGIDPSSVRIRIDGRDVTRHARIDRDGVRVAGDLDRGRHVAEVTVRDRAGNVASRTWSFDVREPQYGWGYGRR